MLSAWHELGRDFGGSPLVSEKRAWLDEAGITGSMREEYKILWRALEAEAAELREAERAKTNRPPTPRRRAGLVN